MKAAATPKKTANIIENNPLTSIQPSRDHLIAEYLFNDVGRIVEEAFLNNLKSKNCTSYNLKNIIYIISHIVYHIPSII